MPEDKGTLLVRLPKSIIERLKVEAERTYGPPVPGSSGGASRLVREIIFERLGLDKAERPVEWGASENPEAVKQRERRRSRKAG